MSTKKSKKSAKAKVQEKVVSKKEKALASKETPVTNIRNGKIFFGRGSAQLIQELFIKYEGNKKKIEKGLQKAVDAGDVTCGNVPGRVNRILFEINSRIKAGYKVA